MERISQLLVARTTQFSTLLFRLNKNCLLPCLLTDYTDKHNKQNCCQHDSSQQTSVEIILISINT